MVASKMDAMSTQRALIQYNVNTFWHGFADIGTHNEPPVATPACTHNRPQASPHLNSSAKNFVGFCSRSVSSTNWTNRGRPTGKGGCGP